MTKISKKQITKLVTIVHNQNSIKTKSNKDVSNPSKNINSLGDSSQESTVLVPYLIEVSGKDEGEIEVELWSKQGTFNVGEKVYLYKPNFLDQSQNEEYDYPFEIVWSEGNRFRVRWPSKIFGTKGWWKPANIFTGNLANEVLAGSEVDLYMQMVKYNNLIDRNIVASGWIVDYSFNNAIGKYDIVVTVDEEPNVNGTTTALGSLYSNRPVLSNVKTEISSPGRWMFSDDLNISTVNDDDNAQLTIQLLLKRHANDPAFDGDERIGKPSYITDNSYAEFTEVRIGNRISSVYSNTAVRWEFFGTIEECNEALKQVRLIDKKGGSPSCVFPDDPTYPGTPETGDDWTLDYFIEVRAIDGWTRTFNTRGYN